MVVVIIPVLRRPHRVAPLLESLVAATPEPHRVLFVCDPDDGAERDAVDAAGAERIDVAANYAGKINAGYRATTEPLMFLAADDVHFHPHWLERAVACLNDPAIGVVGTNDLGNPRVMAGLHATHSLVTRDYVDRFGTIDEVGKVLHESYPHEYVDTEFVETAKARCAWAFARDSIVEHLHPHWGKAPTDALYDAHPQRMQAGARIFKRRRYLWER